MSGPCIQELAWFTLNITRSICSLDSSWPWFCVKWDGSRSSLTLSSSQSFSEMHFSTLGVFFNQLSLMYPFVEDKNHIYLIQSRFILTRRSDWVLACALVYCRMARSTSIGKLKLFSVHSNFDSVVNLKLRINLIAYCHYFALVRAKF